MTVYILVLAIMFEGQTHIFQFGNRGEPMEFTTKAACEKVLAEQRKEVPELLKASPGATLQAIQCVARPARNGV